MQEQEQQVASPETDHGHDRKRRRKVLSCTDCRRRKVQCDRNLPACGRCIRANKTCVYEDETPPVFNGNNNGNGNLSHQQSALSTSRQAYAQSTVTVSREVWDDLLSRLLQQERTIEHMHGERAILTSDGQRPHNFSSSGSVIAKEGQELNKEILLFRGKAFKTQFHGPTDARTSLTQVPEAFEYTRDIYRRSPALVRYQKELSTARKVRKTIARSENSLVHDDIFTFLPQRDRADAMIELYIDTIDKTYGILHTPSFRWEYDKLWHAAGSGKSDVLALTLLMIACVECLYDDRFPMYVADSPVPRERAIKSVRACEHWLAQQSQKHTTLEYFQIHCLLLIAKEINGIKLKRRWTESGTLLRLAVSSGLHRNTDLLQKPTSPFDKEMRKRIWNFIVETDLQTSLDRGAPAVSNDYPSDCGLPSNLDDDDFDDTVTSLPPSRPSTELTKMSYLRLSGESRALRARLTKLMNQPRPPLSYSECLKCTEEIEQSLKRLPDWTGVKDHGLRQSPSLVQGVALLRIQLEQYLLVLHAFAARTATTESEGSFSKTVFLATSRSILRELTELAAIGRRFLLLYRRDVMRIFVCVGQLGVTSTKGALSLDAELARSWLEVADGALGLFEDRVTRSGSLQWTFSFAIYDLVRRQLPAASAPKEFISGVDRVYRLAKYILENQEASFAMRVATYEDRPPSPVPFQATNIAVAVDGSSRQPAPNDGQSFYNDNANELLDWNFDDWMLYGDTFWQQDLSGAGPV